MQCSWRQPWTGAKILPAAKFFLPPIKGCARQRCSTGSTGRRSSDAVDAELGFDLEQNTTTVRSALKCRSEDIARRVDDQSCVGIGSINAAAEAMEDFLGPAPSRCGSQFVHRTVTVGAAIVGRAVEIAGGIGY